MTRFFCSILAFAIGSSLLVSGSLFAQQEKTASGEETAAAQIAPESLKQKASYLIGYDWVKNLKLEGVDFELENLIRGITDASEGKMPPMTDEEIQSVLFAFQRLMETKRQEQLAKLADENMRQGLAFLKKNLLEEGVTELENGLQFVSLKKGDGKTPRITDSVNVHIKGMFVDGTTFQTTAGGQPVSMTVGGGLRGISNALQKMKVGDKWKLFIPPDQAFGIAGDGGLIGPNQVLIYEVELVEIIE